jgi:hypothetical protein
MSISIPCIPTKSTWQLVIQFYFYFNLHEYFTDEWCIISYALCIIYLLMIFSLDLYAKFVELLIYFIYVW